jgi:hypothetical protein
VKKRALILGAAAVSLSACAAHTPPPPPKMPDVIGMTSEQAEPAIKQQLPDALVGLSAINLSEEDASDMRRVALISGSYGLQANWKPSAEAAYATRFHRLRRRKAPGLEPVLGQPPTAVVVVERHRPVG